MGIRIDRHVARPTNGPMLFFSDPSAESDLGEEIRGAITSCLSVYAYRRPGDLMVSFGSSEGVVKGIGVPGFVIAPFLESDPTFTIPYKPCQGMIRSAAVPSPLPEKSTTGPEHQQAIEVIKQRLQTNGGGKIVSTRTIVVSQHLDPAESFSRLCRAYPDAFVFLYSTPLTGCWIGASPEILLEAGGLRLSSVALAGTRSAGTGGKWDLKNVEEQEMVVRYIRTCLSTHGMHPSEGPTFTKEAGPVEHLCTPITADLPKALSSEELSDLLNDLSPTPALCGLPKDLALHTILETENFRRGYYGGFCGPFRSTSDFSFFVTLRCACVDETKYALFAGGGITQRSDSGEEWEETEMKADTLRSIIGGRQLNQ